MATIDVKDMVFLIPALEADRMRFAFSWQGLQYTFTRLPQGLNYSATIRVAHATLAEELEMLKFPQEVTVGQRISDVLRGGHFVEPVNRPRALATTHPVNWGRDTRRTETRAQSRIHLLGVR